MLIIFDWIMTFSCQDEIGGNEFCALVQKLIEGMLGVGSRFTKEYAPRGVFHILAGPRDGLAVGLH